MREFSLYSVEFGTLSRRKEINQFHSRVSYDYCCVLLRRGRFSSKLVNIVWWRYEEELTGLKCA